MTRAREALTSAWAGATKCVRAQSCVVPNLLSVGKLLEQLIWTRMEFPNLDIPPMTSGRTTQMLIILMFYDLQSQTAGEWEINVSLQPGAQSAYRFDLPPMRIAAVEPGWLPVISGLNPRATYDKSTIFSTDPRGQYDYLHELNDKQSRIVTERELIHPAIASSVAILKDEGQATLDACKTWLEAWLHPLEELRKGEIRIYTEKKLPVRVFKPSKTKKSLPVTAFLQDKAWGNLFSYANNYQSVLIAFFPEGSERAVAGIGLQYSHEGHYFQGYTANMAKTLSVMRGRPFAEEAYGSTLHAFQWVTNHADCYEYLNTSVDDMGLRLAARVEIPIFGRSKIYPLSRRCSDEKGFTW